MFMIYDYTDNWKRQSASVDEIQPIINYHFFIIGRKKSNLDEGGLIFINNLRVSKVFAVVLQHRRLLLRRR